MRAAIAPELIIRASSGPTPRGGLAEVAQVALVAGVGVVGEEPLELGGQLVGCGQRPVAGDEVGALTAADVGVVLRLEGVHDVGDLAVEPICWSTSSRMRSAAECSASVLSTSPPAPATEVSSSSAALG